MMDIDKLINYLERKSADTAELQAASTIYQLRTTITELNARIDDRNAALLSKTVELSECQKQLDELADELSECQKDRDYFKANDRCAMRYLSDVCNIVGGKDFPDMVKQVAVLQKQRDELMARIGVVCEVHIISQTYDRIREERQFAADDMEYDLFAAGWKAAIAKIKEQK